MRRRRLLAALAAAVVAPGVRAGAYDEFFRAVEVDDERTVAALLSRGFDPNAPDEHGQVALYLAMRADSPKVAARLLAQPDLRVDAANAAGETALMMAALKGRLDGMQRLLERGARVDRDGWTPLHYAASGPEPKAVALLLDRGAAIDARAPNGATALMMAARYGDERSVDLLLTRGADPRLRDRRGMSALEFARGGGRESLASRLEALVR